MAKNRIDNHNKLVDRFGVEMQAGDRLLYTNSSIKGSYLSLGTIMGFHTDIKHKYWNRHQDIYIQKWDPNAKVAVSRKSYMHAGNNVLIINGMEDYFKGKCRKEVLHLTKEYGRLIT